MSCPSAPAIIRTFPVAASKTMSEAGPPAPAEPCGPAAGVGGGRRRPGDPAGRELEARERPGRGVPVEEPIVRPVDDDRASRKDLVDPRSGAERRLGDEAAIEGEEA